MKFFSTLPIAIGLLGTAIPTVSALENAGAFEIWTGPGCNDANSTHKDFQNVPSKECGFLPGASFVVNSLLGPLQNPSWPQCVIRLYRGQGCLGDFVEYTPADYGKCKDITTRFSYRIEKC